MTFDKFLEFAENREALFKEIKDLPFVKSAFDYALKYTQNARFYFQEFQLEAYCFSLALHLIILTPLDTNPLFSKYFPDNNDLRLKNIGSIIGSVSDSTSSVSNMAYEGLNNMSVGDAMLMMTSYGAFVKSLNDSLKNILVVV